MVLESADNRQQCDGQRPSCQRCVEKDLICAYDVDPGVSHFTSLRQQHDALATEVNQLHGLIEYIRTRSDVDACETLQRIRASQGLLDIARSLGVTSGPFSKRDYQHVMLVRD